MNTINTKKSLALSIVLFTRVILGDPLHNNLHAKSGKPTQVETIEQRSTITADQFYTTVIKDHQNYKYIKFFQKERNSIRYSNLWYIAYKEIVENTACELFSGCYQI